MVEHFARHETPESSMIMLCVKELAPMQGFVWAPSLHALQAFHAVGPLQAMCGSRFFSSACLPVLSRLAVKMTGTGWPARLLIMYCRIQDLLGS